MLLILNPKATAIHYCRVSLKKGQYFDLAFSSYVSDTQKELLKKLYEQSKGENEKTHIVINPYKLFCKSTLQISELQDHDERISALYKNDIDAAYFLNALASFRLNVVRGVSTRFLATKIWKDSTSTELTFNKNSGELIEMANAKTNRDGIQFIKRMSLKPDEMFPIE